MSHPKNSNGDEEEVVFQEEGQEESNPPGPSPESAQEPLQTPESQVDNFLFRVERLSGEQPVVNEPAGPSSIASSTRARFSEVEPSEDGMMQPLWRPAGRRGKAKGMKYPRRGNVGGLSDRILQRFAKTRGLNIPRGSPAFDQARQHLNSFIRDAITKACERADGRGSTEVVLADMECAVQAATTAKPGKRRDDQDDDGDDGNNGCGGDKLNISQPIIV